MSGPGPQQPPIINKVPFDPGWNDPPPVSYSPQAQKGKPRTLLNKRVAFPLTSPCAPIVHGIASLPTGVPPMPLTQPVLPVVTMQTSMPSNQQASENLDFNSESALKEVTEILYGLLDESSELGSKVGDIRKRIALMENMWSSGQLDTNVQHRMRNLAIALREGEAAAADELHKALMVERVAQVSGWMPGVRRLLHHCAARQDLLAIDRDETR